MKWKLPISIYHWQYCSPPSVIVNGVKLRTEYSNIREKIKDRGDYDDGNQEKNSLNYHTPRASMFRKSHIKLIRSSLSLHTFIPFSLFLVFLIFIFKLFLPPCLPAFEVNILPTFTYDGERDPEQLLWEYPKTGGEQLPRSSPFFYRQLTFFLCFSRMKQQLSKRSKRRKNSSWATTANTRSRDGKYVCTYLRTKMKWKNE